MRRFLSMAIPAVLAAAILLSSAVRADVVIFNDGTRIEGKVVHENADSVTVLFVRDGREATVTYPKARVERIVREDKTSHQRLVDEYHRRAAAMPTGDVRGWWELAAWAGQNGLRTEREAALRSLLEVDPEHADARAELGYEKVDGRWLVRAEALRLREEKEQQARDEEHRRRREQGLVEWEGEWYRPEELQALAAMRQTSAMGDVIERLDRLEARIAQTPSLSAEVVERRFDRLERGLSSLADGLAQEFQATRAKVETESSSTRTRLNDITVLVETLRQEVAALRRSMGR